MDNNVLAVIPARSGSKGLPGKNVKELVNKPLIAWSIEQAKASDLIDHFILSTDSKEYAEVGESYGADVPFIRPDEYATDDAPTSDVLLHALEYYRERGVEYDTVAVLEPTSPLRKPGDIDGAIEKFRSRDEADALVTVSKIHLEHPYITKVVNEDGFVSPAVEHNKNIFQRQQLPEAYFPYGVIYMSDVTTYKQKKTFYQDSTIGYELERWQNYEIDDIYDFICIERIIEHVGDDVEGYE